jgi:TonB family protein
LRERVEATVSLQLDVDAAGDVVAARVLAPAGHGFDEAALTAAKKFKFQPARRGTSAVPATIQLAYEFHLPPAAPAPPLAAPPAPPAPPPAAPPEQTGQDQTTLVLAQRPISAASSFAVQDREFQLRPIGSVQDILRVTPGLVMVQHSGGGKANQYFLRGFDADHGTDIALSVDGVPINLVSHAHGQGFADTNFIIPEAVERVEITKGPYFANQGDFATAGAVNLVARDDFEHSSAGLGMSGSPGHGAPGYRGLLVASPRWETATATFAAEVGRQNGPFDNPENWNKYKLFNKITLKLTPSSTLSFGEMSYGGNWHGSGQIPARAVDEGLISRFGSIDPNEGGDTMRHQLYLQYRLHPTETSEIRALGYIGTYTFDLFSNFTLYLRDPENGDEIEQQDRRTFYGSKVSYRIAQELGSVEFDTTLGADVRGDEIHEMLWDKRGRRGGRERRRRRWGHRRPGCGGGRRQNVVWVATATPRQATARQSTKAMTYARWAVTATCRRSASSSKLRAVQCATHPIHAKPIVPTARCSFRSKSQPTAGAWRKSACFRRARYSG